MLQSYSLEGFKSIKNLTEVDLKKTQYQILEDTNVKKGILKGCMFVGGNASGKTNLIEGLRFLLNALFWESSISWNDYLCLFSEDGFFENTYLFDVDGSKITYQIRYQKEDKLILENLSIDTRSLMERTGSKARSSITSRKRFTDISPDSLFLRELWFNTQFRTQPILKKWYTYLGNSVYVDLQEHTMYFSVPKSMIDLQAYIEANGIDELNRFLDECGFDYRLVHHPELNIKGSMFSDLYVQRKGIATEIPMKLESLGNKTLMILLPAYLHIIKNGGMLICDEFSSGLHNDLEEMMVKYFMKHAENSQLFIVSHSTNLLSSSIFRPDQLYAVNFDIEGSNIVRFSSEQPRTGQNYEKMYLGGVFSGLPRYNAF